MPHETGDSHAHLQSEWRAAKGWFVALPRAVERPAARKFAVEMRAVLWEDGEKVPDDVLALAFLPAALHELAHNIVKFGVGLRETNFVLKNPK